MSEQRTTVNLESIGWLNERVSLAEATLVRSHSVPKTTEEIPEYAHELIDPRYLLYGLLGDRRYEVEFRADGPLSPSISLERNRARTFNNIALLSARANDLVKAPGSFAEREGDKVRKKRQLDPDKQLVEKTATRAGVKTLKKFVPKMEADVDVLGRNLDSMRFIYRDLPPRRRGLKRFSYRNFFSHIDTALQEMDSSLEAAGLVLGWSVDDRQLAQAALNNRLWVRDERNRVPLDNWERPLYVAGKFAVAQRAIFNKQLFNTRRTIRQYEEKL